MGGGEARLGRCGLEDYPDASVPQGNGQPFGLLGSGLLAVPAKRGHKLGQSRFKFRVALLRRGQGIKLFPFPIGSETR